MRDPALLLSIDTCGPSGSVALARLASGQVALLGEIELTGRTYSSTLVAAVGELLTRAPATLGLLDAIVLVNGPGSFTGVRVGVSVAKGLAEGASLPVAAVSRLEVLAAKANTPSAALDAHRHELFLRIATPGSEPRELLLGAKELAVIQPPPERIAVCDHAAAAMLRAAWPGVELIQSAAPTAADALRVCAPRTEDQEFVNIALLDGHYLRRSDAEIFGDPPTKAQSR